MWVWGHTHLVLRLQQAKQPNRVSRECDQAVEVSLRFNLHGRRPLVGVQEEGEFVQKPGWHVNTQVILLKEAV
eukprot:g52055.t1